MTPPPQPPTPESSWYAVIDTAQDPALYPLVKGCRDVQCLVAGQVAPVLAATLPYLVRIRADEPLMHRWRSVGIGGGWGIMVQTALSRDALRVRLKTFLNARLPDGSVVWFRFYDPLVLRTFLHRSDPADLTPWFRDISRFVVEGEESDRLYHLGFDGTRVLEAVEPLTRE